MHLTYPTYLCNFVAVNSWVTCFLKYLAHGIHCEKRHLQDNIYIYIYIEYICAIAFPILKILLYKKIGKTSLRLHEWSE